MFFGNMESRKKINKMFFELLDTIFNLQAKYNICINTIKPETKNDFLFFIFFPTVQHDFKPSIWAIMKLKN